MIKGIQSALRCHASSSIGSLICERVPAAFEETLLGLRTDAERFGIIMLHTPEIHMKTWWVGGSGFYYKHWKGKFYPKGLPQRKWFEFYCEHLIQQN